MDSQFWEHADCTYFLFHSAPTAGLARAAINIEDARAISVLSMDGHGMPYQSSGSFQDPEPASNRATNIMGSVCSVQT